MKKLQACIALEATLLIDDLLETALAFGQEAQSPVLLFGDYEWNKRVNSSEQWVFQEKLEAEGGKEWWKDETVELRDDDKIWRVKDWTEVVAWVKDTKQANRI